MEELLKCPKCGAVMKDEGYHLFGWYLNGERIAGGCPAEDERVQVGLEELRRLLAALAEAKPHLLETPEYQRLRAALEQK